MSIQLPFRVVHPLRRNCTIAGCSALRPFSSTAPRGKGRKSGARRPPTDSHDPREGLDQKAPSTIESEAAAHQSLQEDFGLLPGTFVRARDAVPSLMNATSDRWKYEWKWAKTKFRDWYSIKYYILWMKRTGFKWKLKPKNGKRQVCSEAKQYYAKIYKSFASKSDTELQKFCLPGIISEFRERWAMRPHDVVMSWKLRQPGTLNPRIVSNRMAHLPIPGANSRVTPSAVRQVVLRISSQQELTVERNVEIGSDEIKAERLARLSWRPDGMMEPGEGEPELATLVTRHPKDIVEYIVLQKRMLKGEEEESWKVWGFVEPTTLESMRRAEDLEVETKAYNDAQMGLA